MNKIFGIMIAVAIVTGAYTANVSNVAANDPVDPPRMITVTTI